jgi:hypothetical protein
MKTASTPPTEALVQKIADAADCDARTVWKRIAGCDELRPRVMRRIDAAIQTVMGGAQRNAQTSHSKATA